MGRELPTRQATRAVPVLEPAHRAAVDLHLERSVGDEVEAHARLARPDHGGAGLRLHRLEPHRERNRSG